jgi:hypothetical protein
MSNELLQQIVDELNCYDPSADEYKGKYIHKGWAERIKAVLLQRQPLTDPEIATAVKHIRNEYVCSSSTLRRLVRAIEAASKDNNK